MSAAVEARGLELAYGQTPALRGVDLEIGLGESVALMGPSGSGKSTLLHCAAGILVPDAGTLQVLGTDVASMGESARARFRLEHLGLIFQLGELVSELTLEENVMLPLQLLGRSRQEARTEAAEMLDRLGVAEVAGRRAGEVSGGQAQRGAVARALAPRPQLVLADEPTGSLDTVAADAVMAALVETSHDLGSTLLVVTHDHRVAAYLDRHVTITDGRVLTTAGTR
ncbi:ABC transporter ATP-binding protein [Ornithinimicrobium sufpigmenti]|uniref:ABC transporter ATP-binding protein n=1 Tax=Ornithinimicrobium sufpigmenti TaxID=2508882 RepID=UPI0010360564|nr:MULTISPECIES: ABC transporter ATP-binding protein [unclassified Ornithinimicrobium]